MDNGREDTYKVTTRYRLTTSDTARRRPVGRTGIPSHSLISPRRGIAHSQAVLAGRRSNHGALPELNLGCGNQGVESVAPNPG